MDTFTKAYIECMLWASLDDEDTPLDKNYTMLDISESLMWNISRDCEIFLDTYEEEIGEDNKSQAGHDFWLTRNGHGTGFWDREHIYGKQEATILTNACKDFGEYNVVVHEGKLY